METINRKILNAIDLSAVSPYIQWNQDASKYLSLEAGQEPYRLLAKLSSFFADTYNKDPVIDIGTYNGLSALALANDSRNTVITYDVMDWITDRKKDGDLTIHDRSNIIVKMMDCRNEIDTVLKKSKMIYLDIDPHDGKEETAILKDLEHVGYKGIVLLDDIHLNDQMETFWNSISTSKIDMTKLAHWSGTGLVDFGNPDDLITTKIEFDFQ